MIFNFFSIFSRNNVPHTYSCFLTPFPVEQVTYFFEHDNAFFFFKFQTVTLIRFHQKPTEDAS